MASYLTTFALAIASVAMRTLRVAVTSRGNRGRQLSYQGLDAQSQLFPYAIRRWRRNLCRPLG